MTLLFVLEVYKIKLYYNNLCLQASLFISSFTLFSEKRTIIVKHVKSEKTNIRELFPNAEEITEAKNG